MPLGDLITPDAIIPAMRARTRKQALLQMAERAAAVSGLPVQQIYEAVLERELQGATGVGSGIAMPHGLLATAPFIFAVFSRFEPPVDFEARDGASVDIACMLIAPAHAGADYLKALSRVARVLHDRSFAARIRSAKDASAIHLLLTQIPGSRAA